MKKLIWSLALALGMTAALAQDMTIPFYPTSDEYAFSATSSAGTPVKIAAATTALQCMQYRIATVGTAGTTVTVQLGGSSASVASVAIPTPGTSKPTRTIPAGAIEVLSGPSQAWFNAITSTGTITLYVTCGNGV